MWRATGDSIEGSSFRLAFAFVGARTGILFESFLSKSYIWFCGIGFIGFLVAGVPGPIATRLRQILHADMEGGLPGDRIQVPYIEPTAI
jgi:hypothetical protein